MMVGQRMGVVLDAQRRERGEETRRMADPRQRVHTPGERQLLDRIADAVGEMPPPDAEEPLPQAAREAGLRRLRALLKRAHARAPEDPGAVVLRRLNRVEYDATMRDLFGVDLKLGETLPDDGLGYGFDTVGDVLALSPLLLERALDNAERIAAAALRDLKPARQRIEAEKARREGRGGTHRGFATLSTNGAFSHRFRVRHGGSWRLRIRLSADQAGPDKARFDVRVDGRRVKRGEVRSPDRKPELVETRLRLEPGRREIAVAFTNDYYNPAHRDPSERDRNLHVDWFELEGPLEPPRPMVKLKIEPKSRADASKLLEGLRRLEEECPTFQTEKHEVTGDLLVKGSSRTHLDIMLARLESRSKIEGEKSPPTIAYRETITGKGDARYRHKKQSGGSGEFGEVALRIEPLERDAGFEFVSEVVGGAISQSYLPSIEKGIKELMAKGVIAGFPMRDVRVVVYDGKEHSVDSKDVAFQKAGRGAFKEAVQQARPILLEPLCHLELHVPMDDQGEVQGDLASTRRGQITGTNYEGNEAVITAIVPEAEMIDYDAQLRSMTAGEGSYTLEPAAYGNVPGNIQEQIVSEFLTKGSEDD